VGLRDSMRNSAAAHLRPGEPVQAIFPAQTASQWKALVSGFIFFPLINSYRIVAVTPQRIVVLNAGKTSMRKAKGIVMEIPRSTRLGPGRGMWHVVPAGQEQLHVHRAYFKDMQAADDFVTAGAPPGSPWRQPT
jgi:hypothetical protein